MPTIEGVDNEFATATGSNVDSGGTYSGFDDPPSDSTDLTVTSNPGDPEPFLFEVGDTYDLTYSTPDGDLVVEDAEVIRSDTIGTDAGVVVFEGTDASGETVQVVWSPEFDLQGWYDSTSAAGRTPVFYNYDTNPAADYGHVCFAAGTGIATTGGQMPVEALRPCDLVQTLDHGAQPVVWAGQRQVAGIGPAAPVRFAPGSIGNARELELSQMHRVLVRAPRAALYFGADEVLLPARALVGQEGIALHALPRVTYVHLLLARHEVIFAEGAPCESLLLGDQAISVLNDDSDPLFARAMAQNAMRHRRAARPILTMREARLLAGTLALGDVRQPAQPETALAL